MKKVLYILASCFLSQIGFSQTNTENHVKSTTYLVETSDGLNRTGTPLPFGTTTLPLMSDDKIETVTYYDGLGRPIQSVTPKAGGNRETLYSHMTYDQFGRQTHQYLPAPTASELSSTSHLDFYDDPNFPLDDFIKNYYFTKFPEDQSTSGEINAFSETRYEFSALNRVLEQGAPGNDWLVDKTSDSDHTIKFDYQSNTFDINDPNKDNVIRFVVEHPTNVNFPNGNTEDANLVYDGHYEADELYKSITKDENWQPASGKNHTSEEFKNKLGQVILKRTYDNNIAHDTYYVYDDHNNLTFVLSPEGSKNILDANNNNSIILTVLDDLCYQYHYDYRNRLIEKKIPQKGWEYIVYDLANQPILTQDANLRLNDDWLFTKYDKYGRVIYTGKHYFDPPNGLENSGRTELQKNVNTENNYSEPRLQDFITVPGIVSGTSTDIYYDNKIIPSVDIDIYTINYYDDYNWDTADSFEAKYDFTWNTIGGHDPLTNSVFRNSGNSGWDQGFKTEGEITGDGYIQWTASQNNKKLIIGLSNINSAPNDVYNTIDYAIYLQSSGYLQIYEEGQNKPIPTTSYSVNDVFRVERALDQITYYKNGVAFAASATPSTGALIGDSSFYSDLGQVDNLFIGYSSLGQVFTTNAKGLATGSKVRTLGTNHWTTSTIHYDEKARNVYSISRNDYLQTVDAVSSYFDFTGKVLKSHSTHSIATENNPIVTLDDFRYDHTGRLLRQEQKVNKYTKELISKNNYDELGQLEQKQVGGALNEHFSSYTNVIGLTTPALNINKNISDSWTNAGLSTVENIKGDGYVSFSSTQSSREFACGLSYTDTNTHWDTIDYGICLELSGWASVREGGINKDIRTSHVPGDVFMVERRGETIYYLKNGSPFYVSLVKSSGLPMIGDLSIYSNGTSIKNLVLVDLDIELQEVDYTYNIRGWLKSINDVDDLVHSGTNITPDLFAFKLNYNTSEYGGTTKLYNGNISETLWNTASMDPATLETYFKRGYDYSYDALNRIVDADYHKPNGQIHDGFFDVSDITYDLNGNIKTLKRNHMITSLIQTETMDDLVYSYTGNQLDGVADSKNPNEGFIENTTGITYIYDANGNMITDLEKGMNIAYNHLNLPITVETSLGNIYYTYDATGFKLSKVIQETAGNTTTTKYANGYIYEEDDLKHFSHPEGYVDADGLFEYVYQYTDHLGNVRLSYSDSDNNGSVNSAEIVEENNYYPFGLKHKGYNNVVTSTNPAQKLKFGGKEYQDELNLAWYDVSARNYDPALGRWMNLDPLAEDMRRHSPYNYAFDNPIFYSDPDGMAPVAPQFNPEDIKSKEIGGTSNAITSTVVNNKGEIIDHVDDGDPNIYLNTRSEDNIIGTEREGESYIVGEHIRTADVNDDALLPEDFIHNLRIGFLKDNNIELPPVLKRLRLKKEFTVELQKYIKIITTRDKKGLKRLLKQLSKPGQELTKRELRALERLVEKYGGTVRRDLNPVKGKIKKPHVQIEGLGKSIESLHIWLKNGIF